MKNISRNLIFLFLFLFLASFSPTDERTRDQLVLKYILQNLEGIHYSPLAIDDELSGKAFDLYIERLDYGKMFLLKGDVARLQPYRNQLDDQLKQGSLEFFDISNDLISKRINEAEEIYKEILAQPFDFNRNEDYLAIADSLDFCATEAELRERWRLSLKYQTLTRVLSRMEQNKESVAEDDPEEDLLEEPSEVDDVVEGDSEVPALAEAEAWARDKVEKRYRDWFSRLRQVNRSDRLTLFINSFISIYDPHSEYYPPKAKEDFDIRFSGQLEGIGATLQQEDGYVKVREIVAGSASWKQGELEVNDLILKVGQGAEEPVDIVDMRLDDAVRLIRGPKGTEVRLTVKKVDGSTRVIPIIRDVVVLEETFAKSAVLEEEGEGGKIGYIMLPSFYMDFKDPNGRSAASDVLKEINKLKEEGIDGLVIDLRGNGGGSLLDAVKMAGFFIEKGPIVQVKSRYGDPYIFEDKDPDVQYNGPLVVLVNSFSASASEIFAAAMQDYQRAIIVGSSSTFGKGTVQRFFELDKMVPAEHQDIRPLGSIKLTTQKFYRVNGGATQLKGVTPDLVLPDRYSYIDIGEKERDYPMPWTVIEPASYTPWNGFSINYEYLKSDGTALKDYQSTFALIDEQARLLKDQRRVHRYPLHLERYKEWKASLDEQNKKFKDLGKDTFDLRVTPLPEDAQLMAADSVKAEGLKKWHGQLKKDIYLKEAVDLLNLKGIVRSR